eukprot:GGOE01020892.1.p1 GENE.GGOE01020892.1~~GGOE01020892.1.p1  ORF type:complete len:628 (-),score=116.38 GGOE01020892.1:334-2217(-)
MGCTYSEEADAMGMKMVVAVPILANADDTAVVGAQLPVDTSFENLHAELCVEMNPITWYGQFASRSYLCHTSSQGIPLGHFDVYSDRNSTIVYPITTKALESLPLALHFYDTNQQIVGGLNLTIPSYNVELGELRVECALDITETAAIQIPSTDTPGIALMAGEASQTRDGGCIGRVAFTLTVAPHALPLEVGNTQSTTSILRLKLQFADSSDTTADGGLASKIDSSLLHTCSGSITPTEKSSTDSHRLPLRTIVAGIRQAAAACANPRPRLTPADFGRDSALKLSLDNGAVEMKVFAPQAFTSIRALDGITMADFQREWDLPTERLVLDLGAGRSGSLFLRSNSNRFILKTIPHVEVCTFLSLLENYYDHLAEQPDSFIMHVYSLHRFYWSGSWLYIIIFANILFSQSPLPVHIFDLKGRVAKPGKLMARRHEKGIVWKDKDLERFFFLPQLANDRFRKQLSADVAFLGAHNIMDYSLLIGVRERLDCEREGGPQGRSFFRSWMGGTPGMEECHEVYYIGIIDCLTQYNSKKKVANFCKQMLWRTDMLSTVPSKEYGTRFLNFMFAIFPTEDEVHSESLRHPNLIHPISALDTLILNRNQVATPLMSVPDLTVQGASLTPVTTCPS